jgi:hypothetical protein
MVKSRNVHDIKDDSMGVFDTLTNHKWNIVEQVSDNAKEFPSKDFKDMAHMYGFDLEYTSGYDRNGNSLAERSIRNILEPARTIMRHMMVPWGLIDYAVDFVCLLKNYLVRRHLGEKIIPRSKLVGTEIVLPEDLYTFGCLA